MKIKVSCLILLMIIITILTGCWNYREINRLSIVSGVAVDKNESGKYVLTFEVVDLHEGGKDTRIKSKLLESEGDTIFDAVRNSLKYIAPRLYFGHTEIVVISRDITKEGILDILDFLSRDSEPRLTIDLVVSKMKTAREILDGQSITTEIRSFEINDMLTAQKYLSKTAKVQVYQFINELSGDGVSPILPAIIQTETGGLKTSQLSGTGIFKKDILIGFIDEDETRYLNFIKDKIKGGLLVLNKLSNNSKNMYISLEISENKTKTTPEYSNGKVSINLETETKVVLGEMGTEKNYIDQSGRLTLKKVTEDYLKTNIQNLIKKVQKDFAVDIFGFGSVVNSDMPALWQEIGHNWSDIFVDLEVNVDTKIDIMESGLLSNPIKVGR